VHEHESIVDMNTREMLAIAPICALCLWIGVMPQPLIDVIRPDVDAVVALYDTDPDEAQTAAIERVTSDAVNLVSRTSELSTLNPQP
jgi:NADH-quinone oxidoreductase subunit M